MKSLFIEIPYHEDKKKLLGGNWHQIEMRLSQELRILQNLHTLKEKKKPNCLCMYTKKYADIYIN